MFALIFSTGSKIGYAWEPAGNIIFPLYFYTVTGLLIDIHAFLLAIFCVEFALKDMRHHYEIFRSQAAGQSAYRRIFYTQVVTLLSIMVTVGGLLYFYYNLCYFTESMVYMLFVQIVIALTVGGLYLLYLACQTLWGILITIKRRILG